MAKGRNREGIGRRRVRSAGQAEGEGSSRSSVFQKSKRLVPVDTSTSSTTVPVGAPFAVIPGTQTSDNPNGLVIELNWQQDENGRLCVVEQSDPIPASKEESPDVTQIEECMHILPLRTTEIEEADDDCDKLTSDVANTAAGWSIEL